MTGTPNIYDPTLNLQGRPDYWQTIRYVYQHLDFHISEDEAYVITNYFIERWDDSKGQLVYVQDLKAYVYEQCRSRVVLFLPEQKINRVVDLILGYLQSIGEYAVQDVLPSA